jgi:hypothetical protein
VGGTAVNAAGPAPDVIRRYAILDGPFGPGSDWQVLGGNFELADVRPASLCRRGMQIRTLGARPWRREPPFVKMPLSASNGAISCFAVVRKGHGVAVLQMMGDE